MQNSREKGAAAQSDWLNDIAYFESIASRETQAVAQRLRTSINPAADPAAQIESLIAEASRSIGHLGARMEIVETVLANGPESAGIRAIDHKPTALTTSLLESAERWQEIPNLLDLEFDDQQRPFRWSGAQRSIRFRLPIDRSEQRGLRIVVVGLIKQEYLRTLQLLIDGSPVSYELQYLAGANHLLATLPPAATETQTCLDIALPATHSPQALGVSKDRRQLGLALHSIEVTPRALTGKRGIRSRLRGLRRRIRL